MSNTDKTNAQFAFVRDKIVPTDAAFIHISDLAVQRGYGIFDFFKIKDGHPFFLQDHLDRFYESASILKLGVPFSRASIESTIRKLIQQNKIADSGIKLILTGGYSPDGYQPGESNLMMTQHSLKLPSLDQVEKGIAIVTYPYIKEFPAAKTINYMMGIWLIDHLKQENASDVLYYNNEIISEFPRCNVFIVNSQNSIITPASNILKGVTRKNILSIAFKHFSVLEQNITRDELYSAKEVFLTSTTKRVVPIVRIDQRIISDGNPGPVSMLLLKELKLLEEADAKKNS